MWFRKRRNIDLFDHDLVRETEATVSKLLSVPISEDDSTIIAKLSKTEQELSEIPESKLLSIFEKEQIELTQFICLSYSKESTFYEDQYEEGKSNGLSEGFSITYAIYYYFLKNDKQSELGEYLSKRRIPNAKKFHNRLKEYFLQSEGVMLSDSFLQYPEGFETPKSHYPNTKP